MLLLSGLSDFFAAMASDGETDLDIGAARVAQQYVPRSYLHNCTLTCCLPAGSASREETQSASDDASDQSLPDDPAVSPDVILTAAQTGRQVSRNHGHMTKRLFLTEKPEIGDRKRMTEPCGEPCVVIYQRVSGKAHIAVSFQLDKLAEQEVACKGFLRSPTNIPTAGMVDAMIRQSVPLMEKWISEVLGRASLQPKLAAVQGIACKV